MRVFGKEWQLPKASGAGTPFLEFAKGRIVARLASQVVAPARGKRAGSVKKTSRIRYVDGARRSYKKTCQVVLSKSKNDDDSQMQGDVSVE